MSTTAPPQQPTTDDHDHAHGDPEEHLAHHFDTAGQQFDSGKLGIWVFLVTEVLFFSGLFCFYALWRKNHPEIYHYAHFYLDTKWGAINTGVLLLSSLTAAWSVRCAQLGKKGGMILMLVITILCAFGFMGIKTIEYGGKFAHGTGPGKYYNPHPSHVVITENDHRDFIGLAGDLAADRIRERDNLAADVEIDHGLLDEVSLEIIAEHEPEPESVRTFFSIYFCMTGLHGIHVMAGIFIYFWILKRAIRGDFGPKFYGPVDFTALYWHLVDLIWIYLFPLLYLIN